jgi:hypothetical protein
LGPGVNPYDHFGPTLSPLIVAIPTVMPWEPIHHRRPRTPWQSSS